jgi:hypothetical protein
MKKIIIKVITGLFVVLMASTSANADDKYYEVTITNLTQAEKFTPILVASTRKSVKLFKLGEPASPELTAIAEGGDIAGMAALLMGHPDMVDVAHSVGLLEPGDSVTVRVSARDARYISVASMLIPTNDAFFALNGVRVKGKEKVFWAPAYDAGTETNDEDCASIPGPDCGGAGPSPGDAGEGYVYIHGGIHGIHAADEDPDLAPEIYDWRNPVAYVKVVKVK